MTAGNGVQNGEQDIVSLGWTVRVDTKCTRGTCRTECRLQHQQMSAGMLSAAPPGSVLARGALSTALRTRPADKPASINCTASVGPIRYRPTTHSHNPQPQPTQSRPAPHAAERACLMMRIRGDQPPPTTLAIKPVAMAISTYRLSTRRHSCPRVGCLR